jgi:membrane protease YdiL (CAAX protease family)
MLGQPDRGLSSESMKSLLNAGSAVTILLLVAMVVMPFKGLPLLSWFVNRLCNAGVIPRIFYSAAMELLFSGLVAAFAFGVQRRKLSFYRLCPVGWPDLAAVVFTFLVITALVTVLRSAQDLAMFAAPSASGENEPNELPLVIGLTKGIIAGVCEEFLYRGYLIEELGGLIRRRKLAGCASVVIFALGHEPRFGWSLSLLPAAIGGCALTILYFRRDNLWACMLLHALVNSYHALGHRP